MSALYVKVKREIVRADRRYLLLQKIRLRHHGRRLVVSLELCRVVMGNVVAQMRVEDK